VGVKIRRAADMADHKLSESAERSVAGYIDGIVAAAKEAERAKILGVVHRRPDVHQ
jgi:hypothetical protein